jgi:porin
MRPSINRPDRARSRKRPSCLAVLLTALCATPFPWGGADAQSPAPSDEPAQRQSPTPGPTDETPDFLGGLTQRSNLLGDMGGVRPFLGKYGVTLGLQETSEVFGNVTGGVQRGAAYDGVLLMGLGVDTEKAFGWAGGTFNISALQIHGRSLTANNLLTLQTATGVEADRSTRLWELWYQQAFFDGRFDVKVGQQSLDQEFTLSSYSGLFINAAMGWPVLPAVDLYAGGPAYPLATLGVRLRAKPMDGLTILAGVFDDNAPGGPFDDDSQVRGAAQSGTKFNLRTGALFIAEVQYAINQPAEGATDHANPPTGLPGTYKLGAWFDTASFPDQRFDDTHLSLADPLSTGDPFMRRHNFSVYGVVDQMVWRESPDSPRSVGVFARLMGAPGDRNVVDFSVNAGVVLKAPLPGRDDDSFGVGFGIANVSGRARGLDQDTAFFTGMPYPVRGAETFIEVTYQYQATPWLTVQPDFQYFFTPSGGIPNPNEPTRRVGNEAVFGMRTNIVF